MADDANSFAVEATGPAAIRRPMQATRLPLRRQSTNGFTLAELVITVGVLVLLVFLATQLLKSAATVTTLGHKQIDADSQARQLLDRMAVDFTQMIKRSDVTYYWKGGTGGSQIGNDQMAFYCAVPGYYSTTSSTTQSPISLIAYRINSQNKAERFGKGLLWNGVSLAENPLVFWQPIAAPTDADYTTSGEIVAPQVFRFEYCYQLTTGFLSITPPANISGIAAIVVDIAVIDPRSKVLLNDAQITNLAGQLSDYNASMVPGQLRNAWQNTINGSTLPRPAVSGIRVYERFFYLSPPSL